MYISYLSFQIYNYPIFFSSNQQNHVQVQESLSLLLLLRIPGKTATESG